MIGRAHPQQLSSQNGARMPFPSPRLLHCRLAAAALTLTLAVAPGMAQTPEPGSQPQPSLAGQPVYTSDGKEIGTVITMGLDEDDEPVLVAEVVQPLGLGPTTVAVPTKMFARKGDRVELTLTEAEVHAKLKE
jgi:sporulation protein YlmC with PRC-barrel domain